MTKFLNDLKADLTDRRLMPLVALTVAALVVAVAWVALSGGSSSSSPTAHAIVLPSGPAAVGGLETSALTPEKAYAETSSGSSAQRHGAARNPFTPLPGSEPKAASKTGASTASASAASSKSTSSGSSGATSKSSGESTTKKTTKTTTKPAAPKTVYQVAILFGVLPAGTLPAAAQLTAYEDLGLSTALPNAKSPLLVYRGVTRGTSTSATFSVVGEAILRGQGSCLPEAQDCQAIDLKAGETEQLEYTPPGGTPVVYELRVITITSSKASASAARRMLSAQPAGQAVLKAAGRLSVPDLVYAQPGLLVFPRRPASAARAHGATVHRGRR
jgi:hypothetical protein